MSDLQIHQIDESHREQWNDFVAQSPHFALMQSYEWGEFKEKLGWKTIRLAVKQQGQITAVAQLLIKPAPLGLFSVGYVPRGPLVDWGDRETTSALLHALHNEAQRHRAIFMKVEPPVLNSPVAHRQLQQYGFQTSSYANQPRATIVIDLIPELDDILANMQQKIRYNIRYSARRGVAAREATATDLDTFYRLLEFTAKRAGFPIRSREYYRQQWNTLASQGYLKLFLAMYGDKVLAARMPAVFGNKAATIHSGSFDTHSRLKPNELLVWESLKWAKARGCYTYDLWGIPDEVGQAVYEGKDLPTSDRTDGLWGVYRFKSGFSKNIVYYIGAYDYVYSPFLYTLITNKFFNADRLGRIAVWMDSLRHT